MNRSMKAYQIGNCTGKPAGVPVLTRTHTRDGSVPVSTGTGLVTGTEFGTRTRTRSGFDPRVCPVGTRVVRVKVCEQARIHAQTQCLRVYVRLRAHRSGGVSGVRRVSDSGEDTS